MEKENKHQYPLAKKAWGLNWNKIMDGDYSRFQSCITHVFADNRNKAKVLLLPEAGYEKLYLTEEKITYANMPVIRYKDCDLYHYEGKELSIKEINKLKNLEKRKIELNRILSDEKITHCLIKKNGSYYCSNHCEYTQFYLQAGVYPKREAVETAFRCTELDIIPIDNVKHNEQINKEIERLKLNFL